MCTSAHEHGSGDIRSNCPHTDFDRCALSVEAPIFLERKKGLGIAGLNPSKGKTHQVEIELSVESGDSPSVCEGPGLAGFKAAAQNSAVGRRCPFEPSHRLPQSPPRLPAPVLMSTLMGPRAVSAPDCLRSLGNSERKPFKSACLENAKPAELGQTLPWVSLRGDSEISRGAGKSGGTLTGPEGSRDEICVSTERVIFFISKPDVKACWFLVIYRLRT